ncbi:MAG: TetR/AcrR family transcriptional regulator [Sphingobium sp.]
MERKPDASQSRRERNKAATREALAEAAVQLAMRHGVDALRNEDIADAAGVSSRTFSNYFANKYEALTFRHMMRMHYAADALRGRPPEEPFWDSIRAALSVPWNAGQTLAPPSVTDMAEVKLLFGNRTVQGEILKHATDRQNEFARAIADRLGLPEGEDFYPRSLAAAATIVTQIAIDEFLHADPPVAQLPLILKAVDLLENGFPLPGAAHGSAQA